MAEKKQRHIAVISGKGGVGKTTTTVNLGIALQNAGHNVVLVDSNLDTPNLGLHLEIPQTPTTLNNVLTGEARITDALYEHKSGVKIVPASLSLSDVGRYGHYGFKDMLRSIPRKYDTVLIDCSPGLGYDIRMVLDAVDEVLVVTNPYLPALIDSLKSIKFAKQIGTNVRGVVLNKATGSKYDIDDKTILEMLDQEVLAKIPFDKSVLESIFVREPLVNYGPRSPAARGFRRLAAVFDGGEYQESAFEKVLGFFGR